MKRKEQKPQSKSRVGKRKSVKRDLDANRRAIKHSEKFHAMKEIKDGQL